MAEALLKVVFEPVLEPVLHHLSSLIGTGIGSLLGVDDEMKRLSSTLTTIQAVLQDAEEKQPEDKANNDWLQKLKDAAQVVDDILDDCATEAIRLEYQANKGKKRLFSGFSPESFLFRRKIAKKMEEISGDLDKIAEERKFHLGPTFTTERGAEVMRRRESSSIIPSTQVYGREEEKEKIVQYLTVEASNFEDLSLYPIFGMGGLGKTTLAQLIFNDENVAEYFEPRIWVCVSGDFDLKRICKAIIESATKDSCHDMVLEALTKKVQELVGGKRYLLVLDDTWNEDPGKWDEIKDVMTCGSKGASIIVTTRNSQIATILRTKSFCELSFLSFDSCWELFRSRAFKSDQGESEELVAIGKEIVRKCGGVPLAAKALGSLLFFKEKVTEWDSIRKDIPRSLSREENTLMPILKSSYLNLTVKLRRCFAFCAIFPKDHDISKCLLIELWMANGFLPSERGLEVEDVGDRVWKELCWRSFFQDIKIDELGKTSSKMHDLIHDLAQIVAAEEVCCINDSKGFTNLSERTQHLSINTSISANECDLLQLPRVKSLRTCMVKWGPVSEHCLLRLMECNSLRVLQCIGLIELPPSIGYLRHLRYLNLSCGNFKILPESICDLWNLQVLNLNCCRNLESLPNNLTRLGALRHLHLIRCDNLSSLPSGIGQLTFLKTLNVYFVDKKEGFLLTELERLNLTGKLHIQHLEKVRSVTDAKKANMVNKNLDDLRLSWRNNGESESQGHVEQILEAQILEALEPNLQLKSLAVIGYGGDHFPQWMGSATFKDLYDVKLMNCDNCLQLPSLGKLPSLKKLTVENMNKVQYVDEESWGAATGFKALEYLSLEKLPKLERLLKEDGQNIFPRLSRMDISECPKLLLGSIHDLHNLESLGFQFDEELASFPDGTLRNLTSLKDFGIFGYEQLKVFQIELTSLNALEKLHIENCDSLELITEQTWQGLHSLKTLIIRECPKLKLSSDGFQYLTSLQRLSLDNCSEVVEGSHLEILQHLTAFQSLDLARFQNLASLPDCFGSLSNLRSLEISGCPKLIRLPISIQGLCNLEELKISGLENLASLPDCFGSLSNLRSLHIKNCPKLTRLPISIQGLCNLEHLDIWNCPELKKRCEKETGEDWRKIAHVRNLRVV